MSDQKESEMEPMQRMMVIRLLDKISRDKETADRLQIADSSTYRKDGKINENINKK